MSKQKPTAIDLFAGAGGFSLAAQKASFQVLAAVDFNNSALQTKPSDMIAESGKQIG